jgi:hypothetical protein
VTTLYVSYRSSEHPFVSRVVALLSERHDVRIDYEVPVGADWRSRQLEELRSSEVFVVFVSSDTRESDFQNAEMGGARFCSAFLDGKLIIPVLIDRVDPPRPLADLDALDLSDRDHIQAAREIEAAIARRSPRVGLFISHAHSDADLASRLVDVVAAHFDVPDGELRCTSAPGYQLALGSMAPEALRRELGSAACVIGLLTPTSVANDWVLFELGAAWATAKLSIPLLAGGLLDQDIPGPFRGAVGGQLNVHTTLDRMLDRLDAVLPWRQRTGNAARNKAYELVEYVRSRPISRDDVTDELGASFSAKLMRIGPRQHQILHHILTRSNDGQHLTQDQLAQHLTDVAEGLYYRLEQLRLLGFLTKVKLGESRGQPKWGWKVSERYRREVGL